MPNGKGILLNKGVSYLLLVSIGKFITFIYKLARKFSGKIRECQIKNSVKRLMNGRKWCKKEERKDNVLILRLCPRSGERCCATSTVEFGARKWRKHNFSLSSYRLHFGVVENWCHAHSPTFLPVIPEEPKPSCLGSGQHWVTQRVPKPDSHLQGD